MDLSVLIIYVISVLLSIILTRVVFEIPRLIRLQKVQTKLLQKIAEKHGVSPADIFNITYPVQDDLK